MTIVKLVPLVPLVRLEPLPNGRPGQTGGRTGGLGESPQKVGQLVGGVHRQLPQSTYPTGQPGIRDGTVEMLSFAGDVGDVGRRAGTAVLPQPVSQAVAGAQRHMPQSIYAAGHPVIFEGTGFTGDARCVSLFSSAPLRDAHAGSRIREPVRASAPRTLTMATHKIHKN